MKYMLIMRASDEAYASFQDVEFEQIVETMGRFHDEMIAAGVVVAMEGLEDASLGVVVDYSSRPAGCQQPDLHRRLERRPRQRLDPARAGRAGPGGQGQVLAGKLAALGG